jgi:glycosyltransferase involved in cell wall biosynthesis
MTEYSIELDLMRDNRRRHGDVTVCISLYNYGSYVTEALDSVARQTVDGISLVVVDDCSADNGPERVRLWMTSHKERFVESLLVRNRRNSGLAATRNLAVKLARSPYVFILDADNQIYPRCLERLLAAIRNSRAAMAYCVLEQFGDAHGLMGSELWSRDRLADGNYVDAMALVRRKVLLDLRGYARLPVQGWEDYDLWCRFAEKGLRCVRIPEILARYRIHSCSMINTVKRQFDRTQIMVSDMKKRHPWLRIGA